MVQLIDTDTNTNTDTKWMIFEDDIKGQKCECKIYKKLSRLKYCFIAMWLT